MAVLRFLFEYLAICSICVFSNKIPSLVQMSSKISIISIYWGADNLNKLHLLINGEINVSS
jgi:hypothetical protein